MFTKQKGVFKADVLNRADAIREHYADFEADMFLKFHNRTSTRKYPKYKFIYELIYILGGATVKELETVFLLKNAATSIAYAKECGAAIKTRGWPLTYYIEGDLVKLHERRRKTSLIDKIKKFINKFIWKK